MHKYLSALLWIIGIQAISFVIVTLIPIDSDLWLDALTQSTLTPPDQVFGIVWPILYLLIALAGWDIWHNNPSKESKNYFIAQLLLNFAWTPVVILGHCLLGGIVTSLGVIFSTVMLMRQACIEKNYTVSGLLTPYLLWMLFALYLNTFMWMHN